MEFKELFKGIDSLYVSFIGTLREGVKEQLEVKKVLAQSDNEKEQALAKITIDDHCFEVKDRGTKYYSYILEDNWYHIQITASKRKIVPSLYVQISSELLTCYGLNNSINKLRGIVNKLIHGIEEETISRADIFVDFITNVDLEKLEKQSWVTRAKNVHKHWTGDIFTGWSIGQGGVISARLYDKTVEIEKSDKNYLKEIWDKQGWNKDQKVWRCEFQLRRGYLEQMSITTFSDLLLKMNDVWRYCTYDWLRLAISDMTINKTRWNIYPLWEKIQQILFVDGNYTGITRYVDKSRIPSDKTLFQNGMGYITAFAAREGYENITEEIMIKYMGKSKDYIKKQTKHSNLYCNEEDYLKTKIHLKKKRYNKVDEMTNEVIKD